MHTGPMHPWGKEGTDPRGIDDACKDLNLVSRWIYINIMYLGVFDEPSGRHSAKFCIVCRRLNVRNSPKQRPRQGGSLEGWT